MSDEEEEDVMLKQGTVVDSNKTKYKVDKLLGEGGFGAVYKVIDLSPPSTMVKLDKDKKPLPVYYAMKVEKKIETRIHSKLKMEIAILKLVHALHVQNKVTTTHFTSIVDRGKKDTYFFLVMELVGKSLADLKAAQRDKVFSICTGLGASMQCLESCADLHNIGFIHRDLKPANYACGLGERRHTIYILDFGIARKILNDKNELKTPRNQVKFKGTVRFAPLSCHKGLEGGYKDDCESWFYLMMDLILKDGLPWRKLTEKNDVQQVKEQCKKGGPVKDQLFAGVVCKENLVKLFDYLHSMEYQDHVDYDFAYRMLKESCKQVGGNIDDAYDWEKDSEHQ